MRIAWTLRNVAGHWGISARELLLSLRGRPIGSICVGRLLHSARLPFGA